MTSYFNISCCFIIFIIRTLYYLGFMYKIPLGLCRVVTGAVFGNCAKETITVLSCRIYKGCLFLKCMSLFVPVTLRSPQPQIVHPIFLILKQTYLQLLSQKEPSLFSLTWIYPFPSWKNLEAACWGFMNVFLFLDIYWTPNMFFLLLLLLLLITSIDISLVQQ